MRARTVLWHCRPQTVVVGVDVGGASALGARARPVACMPLFADESELYHDY